MFWQNIVYYALFLQPVWILYYQEKGLTVTEFFLIQPIFSLMIVLFEIPAGYLSDITNRRTLLILSAIIKVIAFYILWQAQSFWILAFVGVLLGLSSAFYSGIHSAMIYDTLLALGREKEHKKYLSKFTSCAHYSAGISAIISGFLFLWYVDAPAILSLGFCCISLVMLLFLYEPQRNQRKKTQNHFKDMLKIAKYSLHDHSDLKWLILFSAIITISALKGFWVIQPVFQNMEISVVLIGMFAALTRFLTGASSQFTHKLEQLIPIKYIFIIALVFAVATFIWGGMDFGYWTIIPISLIFLAQGATKVLNHDLIHQRVSSDMRATVMSVESIVTRILFAIVTPIFGYLLGAISLQFAMTVMGIFVLILAGLSFIMLQNKKVI